MKKKRKKIKPTYSKFTLRERVILMLWKRMYLP